MKDKLRELAERWKDEYSGISGSEIGTVHVTQCTCAAELLAILDAEGDGGAVGVSPEDRFEQFVAAAIARSPEPLRELGEYLTRVLDEDQWPTADRLLLQLATLTHPARSGVVSDEDVRDAIAARDKKREWMQAQDGWKDFMDSDFDSMKAALEHFAKGERHER